MILGLLFTTGMSVKAWLDCGRFSHEKEIYEYEIEKGIFEKIYWFTYGYSDDELAERLKKEGKLSSNIEVVPIPKIFCRVPYGFQLYSYIMPWFQKKYFDKISIVKSNQMNGAWGGVIARKKYGIPFLLKTGYTDSILYAKMYGGDSKICKKWKKIEKFVFQHCTIATVTSNHSKKYVCSEYGIPDDKIYVVRNYINTQLFRDFKQGRRADRFVFVGRIVRVKNIKNIVSAVNRAGFGLDIYGDGELRNDVKEYAKNIHADVRLEGIVENHELPKILNSYKYFILGSISEGMPKSLIEAMACGCICIGTNVSGIRELIFENSSKWLHTGYISDDTTEEGLYAAIVRAVKDTDQHAAVIENSRKLINEEYEIGRIVKKEAAIVKAIMQGDIDVDI